MIANEIRSSGQSTLLRRVWIEPVFKAHSGYVLNELVPYPPSGYEFVRKVDAKEKLALSVSRSEASVKMYDFASNRLPLQLLVSLYYAGNRTPSRSADLTLALHHLVLRQEPWVLETDVIYEVIGWDFGMFWKLRGLVKKILHSGNLKGVIFWTRFGKRLAESLLPWPLVWEKSYAVPRAVHPKEVKRGWNERQDDNVRFLFMGSANSANEFVYRGGPEVLEAFSRLAGYRKNTQLIIRSEVPRGHLERYSNLIKSGRIRVISHQLDGESLSSLYRNSDALVFPGHYESWVVALEAMSYGLPVIATNQWQISDIVKNRQTGLLISESASINSNPNGIPFSIKSGQLRKAILKGPYEDQLVELEDALATLVDNESLRMEMGRLALEETRSGEHSLQNRNRILGRIFDGILER